MGKLWEKGYSLNGLIEQFTVGNDYRLDTALVKSDCLAGIAHAEMLRSIGILTDEENRSLAEGLLGIIHDADTGSFPITPEDEDCHTAIENRLTERCGEAGKKIHTGRSRNDQVLTALRLYSRSYLHRLMEHVLGLVETLFAFADRNAAVPMPGRTHTQAAMPSSVGLWAASFAEDILDSYELLETAYSLTDQCPLGAAASYGVPLPLDREMTAKLLGFSKVQNNVLYANNSRGKMEAVILDALEFIGAALAKLSQDLILFSLPEFGYFTLPPELCSGSSIMPQKKNPDGLELVRAKTASLAAYAGQIKAVIRPLVSGYNRDFQETKEPFFRGLKTADLCILVLGLTVRKLQVNREALAAGFTPEIFATDAALRMVREGKSFREAYRYIGTHLQELAGEDPVEVLRSRTSKGTAGNLCIDEGLRTAAEKKSDLNSKRKRAEDALFSLAGRHVDLLSIDPI